ncbi:alcohol dehydrogenase [Natribacillus halophilus]|uniref:Alcohol dehydrogenase n=1 Tax=Natribacillus halophilus TaxID=549003 RepID=A0A1G8KXN2_9BACI|nr:alcohol dehydrogenase [Natribacillus halophilus]
MKQNFLVLCGKEQLEWRTRDLPPLENDEVLVKTILGSISISAELPQYNETDLTELPPEYPKNTGYESYGEVIKVGKDVQSVQMGDRVISFYGHKDVAIIKENKAIPVPKTIYGPRALLTILSCDAAKGVFKVNLKRNDKALVTGMGPIGLLTAHFLKHYMKINDIDIVEPDPHRREIAKVFGAGTNVCMENGYNIGFECSGKIMRFSNCKRA